AITVYHAVRVILGLGMPSLVLASLGFLPVGISGVAVVPVVVCLAALGVVLPSFYIDRRQKSMRTRYRTAFPDFMDLLVVCVESGLAFQPALERISREIASSSP